MAYRFKRRYLLLALIVAAVASLNGLVRAQDTAATPFVIVAESTESNYREEFTFRVQVRSTVGKITRARIIWQERGYNTNTARLVPIATPRQELKLSYDWYIGFDTMPPFQDIYYRWEFYDDQGNVYLTPRQAAEVTDNTRDWQKLTSADGKVAVYWYDQDQAFGQALLDTAERGYNFVAEATGFTPEDELNILMYNNRSDFCEVFSPGTCLIWYAGVTLGSATVQWLLPDYERFVNRQVIPHELAHAFLNDWMGGQADRLPRWFNEGQATNNEFEGIDLELERARALAQRGELTRLPLFDQSAFEGRDSSRRTAEWYAQSASLVYFLYENWGANSLGNIVEAVRTGTRFEDAFEAQTGLSMDDYELAWREWLGGSTTLAPLPTIFPTMTLMPFPPTPTHEPTPRRK
jgi:hypothetical protein